MSAAPLGTHRTRILEREDHHFVQLLRFQASCDTCGWVGELRPSEDQAEDDGNVHEAATGRPTDVALDDRGRVLR